MSFKRILVLSDAHIPFHERGLLELIIQYAIDRKIDTINFAGDMADCASFSKFTLPLCAMDWDEEKKIFLREMKKFNRFNKVFMYGNHCYRIIDEYARNARKIGKAMELEGRDIIYDTLGLDKLENLTVVPYMGRVNLGSLTLKHGSFWRGDAGMSAKIERTKEGGSTLTGHTHRLGSCPVTLSGVNPIIHGGWENGCLCQLHAWYKRGNSVSSDTQNWQHGFSEIFYEDKEHGKFHVQQYYIVNGEFVGGNGKLYKVRG
jgi:hypothetical protein